MKITYLYHSGFAVELKDEAMVFDYYRGELPDFGDKKVTVFVSHSHPDHYNPAIFQWRRKYPDITYVLSDCVREKAVRKDADVRAGSLEDAGIYRLGVHTDKRIGSLRIRTLRSNDEGAAFLVTAGERNIYHAGDLNWWHWEGEPDEDNRFMEKSYREELDYLKKLLGSRKIQTAFLVLDPRQEEQFYYGFDAFMRTIGAEYALPMHMWDDYSVISRLKQMDISAGYRDRIVTIQKPGEQCIDCSDAEAQDE